MRLEFGSLLLALAALGSVPQALGRAVPNTALAGSEPYTQDNHLLARVVVPGPNRKANTALDGNLAAQRNRNNRIGALATPFSPPTVATTGRGGPGARIQAGPLGAQSQRGALNGQRGSGLNPQRNTPGSAISPLKQQLPSTRQKKPGALGQPRIQCRGTGCGTGSSVAGQPKSEEELLAIGKKSLALAASPKNGAAAFIPMYKYYNFNDKIQPHNVQHVINHLSLGRYGFQPGGAWKFYDVSSIDGKAAPVARVSISRVKVKVEGAVREYVAIVAHERYARRDGNRFALDDKGNSLGTDSPNKAAMSMPVWQLVYHAAELSGFLANIAKVDSIFFISDTITEGDAGIFVTKAIEQVSTKDEFDFDAELVTFPYVGADATQKRRFEVLAGLDQNHSFLNTAGNNPVPFAGFQVDNLQARDTDLNAGLLSMAMELKRKV